MKQRFSSLDVKVIAHELSNNLRTLRVTNIYDLSSRIFLIKFHKPDHREQLVIDSGFRCHLTSFARTTAAAPSPFVSRLRKFLRTRRVTSVSQVGTDRIIEFQFSDGEYRLFLEFYAGGNIILTDKDLRIISLLRTVEEGAEHEKLRVGLEYNLSLRQNYGGIPPLTKERVRDGLRKAIQKQEENAAAGKKVKKGGKDALRKALAVSITEFPPMLMDHALTVVGFDSTIKPEQVLEDESTLEKLMETFKEAQRVLDEITSADTTKGYILTKPNPAAGEEPKEGEERKSPTLYDDFHPFKPKQFESDPNVTFIEFEGFNKTVDEFFSSIEGQKLESKLHERELAAKKKLEAARREHESRIGGLQQVQELNIRKAGAIQANVERVQEAVAAVQGLLDKGMDWVEVERLIEREKAMRNPVAEMIKLPLKLKENTITLLLAEQSTDAEEEGYETSSMDESSEEESESEDEDSKKRRKPAPKPEDKRLAVDIDIGLSPWANASVYYEEKKNAAVKEEKTKLASTKALKSTEKKIQADLKKSLNQEKEVLRPVRKQFWFEKFYYFISSDGYLVLGGKDAQQNEILYKKYLRKGDIYVHADLQGAASVIIKNNPQTPDAPIPPSTLSQAGNLSVATSSAWDSKAVMSAWWVNSDQVSKTAPTGEYLTTGGFMIHGKKNYLPPSQLLLGFAVMFQISEESKARHVKHRVVEQASPSQEDVTAPETAEEKKEREEEEREEDVSDSDEEFPDAKLESGSETEGEDEDTKERQNPLQTATTHEEDSPASAVTPDHLPAKEPPPQPQAPGEAQLGDARDPDETQSQISQRTNDTRGTGKRHLSARERRLLRKGQPLSGTSTPASKDDDEESAASADEGATVVTTTTKAGSGNKPLPRGKRAKAKKIATKYAHQDEEDRALAMRILGSKTGQEAAEEAARQKREKEAKAQADKERRREQHLRAQAIGKAAEEARRAALEGGAEEGGEDLVDEEAARLEQVGLDSFTGRPLPGDELITAIPVCAPWAALATYKYKVKLQPGTTKKGKAVKEILSKWDLAGKEPKWMDKTMQDTERIWPREMELIRAWKDTEIFGIVPVGKVRVMLSGGLSGSSGSGSGGAKGKGKGGGRGGKGGKKGK